MRPPNPIRPTLLALAMVLALAASALPATPAAAATTIVSGCSVNLRAAASTRAAIHTSVPRGTRAVAATVVTGGSWRATCGGRTVSGSKWYRITSVSGRSVQKLFGVSAVYAAKGLFRTVTSDPAPAPGTGSSMPTTDLPGWKLRFTDDFNGLNTSRYSWYPSSWGDTRYQQGDRTNGGRYSGASNVSVANGVLDIHLRRDADDQPRSTAFVPRLAADGGTDQRYGRYAIRFKATSSVGWKTAWLLWPQSNVWPRDGEIDFPEGDLNGTISAFMHKQGATSGSDQAAFSTGETYTTWHTAVIEWKPGSCRFILDGRVIGTATDRVPNTPMHWVIQTETALSRAVPAAHAHVYVDWIAAWSYAP